MLPLAVSTLFAAQCWHLSRSTVRLHKQALLPCLRPLTPQGMIDKTLLFDIELIKLQK